MSVSAADLDLWYYSKERRRALAVENRKLNPYAHSLPDLEPGREYVALPWGGFSAVRAELAADVRGEIMRQEDHASKDYTKLFALLHRATEP